VGILLSQFSKTRAVMRTIFQFQFVFLGGMQLSVIGLYVQNGFYECAVAGASFASAALIVCEFLSTEALLKCVMQTGRC
jgi:hypothetical protein